MSKNIFLPTLTTLFLLCSCSGTELKNPEKVVTQELRATPEGDKSSDLMKAQAIKESDLHGQAKFGLAQLQAAFDASKSKMPSLGEVTVLLDENFVFSIQNKKDGIVFEQRADLRQLKSDLGSFEWLVDTKNSDFPGVRIPVIEGGSKVEILKNGSLQNKENFLEIKLCERGMVQTSLSGVINAIRASKGEPLEGK